MEPSTKPDYNELLRQIHQLPDDEFEKLVITLSSELNSSKAVSKKNIRQLLLKAPTWDDQQYEEYQHAREFINQSRLR